MMYREFSNMDIFFTVHSRYYMEFSCVKCVISLPYSYQNQWKKKGDMGGTEQETVNVN